MDEYENLVVAVAMIDAAIRALEEAENQDQVVEYLHETRNRLNDDRIVCLGNGRGRPFWAADRIEELEAKLAKAVAQAEVADETLDKTIDASRVLIAKMKDRTDDQWRREIRGKANRGEKDE